MKVKCPKCGEEIKTVGETNLMGMKTGEVKRCDKCHYQIIVSLPGKEKYFTGAMLWGN